MTTTEINYKEIISYILLSDTFTIDDKVKFLNQLKEYGIDSLPRNIYYRLKDSVSKILHSIQNNNLEISEDKYYWRECITILSFLNIIELPPIKVFYFVDDAKLFYPSDTINICNISSLQNTNCNHEYLDTRMANIEDIYADCAILKIPFVYKEKNTL